MLTTRHWILLTVASTLHMAAFGQAAMLRISCDGADVGAEVSVNGQFKGECPVDIQVNAGLLQIQAVKKVDAFRERTFAQEVRIAEGTVKKLEVVLGGPSLNAEGKRIEAQRAEESRQRAEAAKQREMDEKKRIAAAHTRSYEEFAAQGLQAGTGKAFRDCLECPEMVWIPPGKPQVNPLSKHPLSDWIRQVEIRYPLAVGKFEVTYEEYDRCTAEMACQRIQEGFKEGTFVDTTFGRGKQPVVNISMEDVRSYLSWLSKKSGGIRYRLLSYAEFVHATRVGKATALPWGNELGSNNANCKNCGSKNGGERTDLVGSFAPNDWGIHDLIGNVSEFVADCASDESKLGSAPTDGSPILQNCVKKLRGIEVTNQTGTPILIVGGSWRDTLGNGIPTSEGFPNQQWVITSNFKPILGSHVGFRIARDFASNATAAAKSQ